MADDEKDRFGDKLRDAEKAKEDQFFAERDRALFQKLKAQSGGEPDKTARSLPQGRCPRCGDHLTSTLRQDVTINGCPKNHGIWLDDAELEKLVRRESSGWLSRILGQSR
jgi:hypothetical protein